MSALRRSTSIVVPLVIGVGLIIGTHYVLWARFVRDVGFAPPLERALTSLLSGVALSIPLAVVTSRFVRPQWSRWWVTPVYVWIGVLSLLLMSLVAVDVLRLAYALASFGPCGSNADGGRVWARSSALVAATMALGASAWAAREGRRVTVKRVEVPLTKLPRALDGFRIVQLSDIHVGPTIGRAFVEHVVARVNALSPDLVAITGDLVDGRVGDLVDEVAPLAELMSAHGTYFVTGNHEYHAGAAEWCEHLETLGVRVLRNELVALVRDGHTLHVAGIDDYESASVEGHGPDLSKAVAGRDLRCPLVLLAHQPKAVHEAVRYGVDLQLSGHTHGGQLWPLGWLLRTTQPAVAGLGRFGETLLYVSCGTGSSGPPMRLGVPAEITELVLRSA